jgi:SAM-dependent methyltransferase
LSIFNLDNTNFPVLQLASRMENSRLENRPMNAVVSLFFLSAGSLLMEVVLTRLFSYLFVQSYVYLLLSIGIAGIGLGAVFIYFLPKDKSDGYFKVLQFLPAAAAILLLGTNLVRPLLPVSLFLTLMFFFSIGSGMVKLFQSARTVPGFLYAADLIGAAAGSIGSYFLLQAVGAWKAVFIIGLLAGFAYLLLLRTIRGLGKVSLLFIPLAVLLLYLGWFTEIETNLLPNPKLEKEMTLMLEDGQYQPRIAETRWSAFGRVDMIESGNPLFKTLFIDGAAGTKMLRMEGGELNRDLEDNLLFNYIGGLPLFAFYEEGVRPGNAFVLGSGGGIDLVTLLLFGYRDITAVEINKEFIDLVREYSRYNGGIYNDHPEIDIIHTEGRSYIRNTLEMYNLIHMSLPIIKSSRNYGNYALTENYLFTYNAISEYREALKPGGSLLVVTHYPNEVLRLLANVLKSFETGGILPEEALKGIVLIGRDTNPALIVKNGPFSAKETAAFYKMIEQYNQRGSTNFVPGMEQRYTIEINREEQREEHIPEFHPDIYDMATGKISLDEFIRQGDENISYVSDNSPFFYQMQRFLPREVIIVLTVALALTAALALLFRFAAGGGFPVPKTKAYFFAVFALLGAGFILVEIRIIQQFILYWQHQTLALSLVLSIVLGASGIGSLVCSRINRLKTFFTVLSAVIVLAAAVPFILRGLLPATEARPFAVKVAVTFASLFPLFFFMGMPFPFFLQTIAGAKQKTSLYPWVMGANSIVTLTGAVLSMAVSMTAGYRAVHIIGLAGYMGVLGLTVLRARRREALL